MPNPRKITEGDLEYFSRQSKEAAEDNSFVRYHPCCKTMKLCSLHWKRSSLPSRPLQDGQINDGKSHIVHGALQVLLIENCCSIILGCQYLSLCLLWIVSCWLLIDRQNETDKRNVHQLFWWELSLPSPSPSLDSLHLWDHMWYLHPQRIISYDCHLKLIDLSLSFARDC